MQNQSHLYYRTRSTNGISYFFTDPKGLCELFDELRVRKVDLVSLKDGFSLASPSGRLHARILASVAEFENEVRGERVRAGQAVARAAGKKWGGRKPGTFVRATPDKCKAVLKMHADGVPITRIASVVELSRPTVYRVLDTERSKRAG